MLGDIGKLLGKSFFLSSFVPAFLFWLGNGITIWVKLLTQEFFPLTVIDLTTAVLILIIGAVFLAMLLRGVNTVVLRMFEGYLLLRFKCCSKNLNKKRANIYREIRELESIQRTRDLSPSEEIRLILLWHEAETRYPPENREILPTLLGNVVRAFEYYPLLRYSMDGVAMWPRLLTVVPKEHIEVIEDAKARVDFLLYSTVLLGFSGAGWGAWFLYGNDLCTGLACIAITFFISYLLYRASIYAALEWGTEVRTTYDVYRKDLLKKLGLPQPTTDVEERTLWDKLSWFIMYSEYSKREGFPYHI